MANGQRVSIAGNGGVAQGHSRCIRRPGAFAYGNGAGTRSLGRIADGYCAGVDGLGGAANGDGIGSTRDRVGATRRTASPRTNRNIGCGAFIAAGCAIACNVTRIRAS
ncbi:hypothetical protein [Ottowia thiooxydans]|uniref:Uncharacterized protein n=1 Tax=Ottowia thiooxydans TaxID=219182 RepID=A0ABV2Q5A3_9BURK